MENRYDLRWYGMMTLENTDKILDLIRQLLQGKRYTFVAVNMYGNENRPGELLSRPEVRTSQEVRQQRFWSEGKLIDHDGFILDARHTSTYTSEDGSEKSYESAGFTITDSYGVWGCHTYADDKQYDHTFENPYIVFDWNKLEITHRAPAGHILYWVIAVERED